MKISKDTAAILKNFAAINPNLLIFPGSKLTSAATGNSIFAEATVEETFETQFGIYDLNEFLGVLNLFDDPDLIFGDKVVTIKEGRRKVQYYAAADGLINPPPNLKKLPDPDVTFDLPATALAQIQRAASVLKVADFAVIGEDSTITIQVGDKKNATSNVFAQELEGGEKTFRVNLKTENLRFLTVDYVCSIVAKKVAMFTSIDPVLTYYVAIESDSTFEF